MKDLEDKLRFMYNGAKQEADFEKWAESVKQAFADAGWNPLYPKNYDYMTGQEWYDRFEKESADIKWTGFNPHQVKWLDVREAAKKAAGIE